MSCPPPCPATARPPQTVPPRGDLPVLLSIPHSCRDYPDALIALSRRGLSGLRRLEDPLVDRLAWRAIAAGAGAVLAGAPRAMIDCNRDEDELDPLVIEGAPPAPSPRARAGLGLVPSRTLRDGPLWRRPITQAELAGRLDGCYRPYHAALAGGLETLAARHGGALLLDCHSMPPVGRHGPQVVIGDRHGATSAPWLSQFASSIAERSGFRVARNAPYAGGAIVARHARPAQHIYALQVEIDRGAYLAADLMSPGVGFDRLALLLESLAVQLGAALAQRLAPLADAAE